MKKRGSKIVGVFLIVILVFLGINFLGNKFKEHQIKHAFAHTTVTLFFHGYGSSFHAEEHMVNAAKKAGITNTVLKANVDYLGNVQLSGKVAKHAKNPIVEVNYDNNRNSNYSQDGQWAKNVVVTLQKKYGMKKMNMVGHSMGNMDIMFYLLQYGEDPKLPKLKKQVAIAGHFNGIIGYSKTATASLNSKGEPQAIDQNYKRLLALRQTYPLKQIKVLNIYGNIGDQSDGRVANVSSRSLKYLLNNREISYQEKEIKNVSHSKLHENTQVDHILINFLWK